MTADTTFEDAGRALENHRWIYARTMPDNPHEYTLRRDWQEDEFLTVVQYIREHGYQAWYRGRLYTQLDVNDHYYWTMGAPLEKTVLINRKRNVVAAGYDAIAPVYDMLFQDAASREEDQAVCNLIGDLSSVKVLDVGCGTGWLLDHCTVGDYTGIDPSSAMLEILRRKHPDSRVICTPLERFVGERYQVVLALFGVASYLTDEELQRIPRLLEPGGRYVIMGYAPGYTPVTYQKTGIYLPYRARDNGLSGTVHRLGGFTIVEGPGENLH